MLENFLTDEECDVLIRLGGDRGYEQSLDVGEEQHDGTFGSKQSEERTSSNAWCIEECWEHNVTQVVHDKLEYLTGIDRKNYEYLQLLRYEERQFYGDHHDYIEHHKEGRSQGPRVRRFAPVILLFRLTHRSNVVVPCLLLECLLFLHFADLDCILVPK